MNMSVDARAFTAYRLIAVNAEYEALQRTHHFAGDLFGRVAVPQPDEALSDPGHSGHPQIDPG